MPTSKEPFIRGKLELLLEMALSFSITIMNFFVDALAKLFETNLNLTTNVIGNLRQEIKESSHLWSRNQD